jgi:hypothetical protein
MTDKQPTQEAAQRLADKIKAYWAERGWDVNVRLEYVRGQHRSVEIPERHEGHWRIHTDLVDGKPTKRVKEAAT